jgi:hypothetical protein
MPLGASGNRRLQLLGNPRAHLLGRGIRKRQY